MFDREMLKYLGLALAIGMDIVVPVLVGFFLGKFLDQKIFESPDGYMSLFLGLSFLGLGVWKAIHRYKNSLRG